MYVRLATRRPATTALTLPVERSAVKEWLAGLRGDPLPMQAGRSVTVPSGEMPVGGAAASSRRLGDASDATAALRLLSLQQERAARDKAEREARRLADLESTGGKASVMLPFEDFDFEARPATLTGGGLDIRRGITAGPGDYDLFVAWSTGQGKDADVGVIHYHLTLPGASPAFGLSDIIVAEQVTPVAAAYTASEQSAHPYAIGALDVTPATANALSVGGTLGLVYQVINPGGSASGKPSVEVQFQVARVVDNRLVAFGALQPQRHDETNLPADFDAARGHPLFGAVRASLASFPRGRYRVTVTAVDELMARRASAEATFEVRGTAESLLREAPVPGQAFRRDSVLSPATLRTLARALAPAAPSEALARRLQAAEAGHFADLMRVDTPAPSEQPIAQALLGLGLYGLGDSPRAVAAQLSQAANLGAPPAPVLLLLGATYALGGDDTAAITAWNQAREGGIDDASVATLLIDAYLRRDDVARAGAMATAALDSQPGNLAARQALAATLIATRRHGDALRLLDEAPGGATDAATCFLQVHAIYAGMVVHDAAFETPAARNRFTTLAHQYVSDGGPHADLVREWIAVTAADRGR
jgi:tetratricopeptide (TPR) repeat protein